jgi:GTP-binding protein
MSPPSLFRQARFVTSAQDLRDLPPEGQGEIAFAGRSNAGKSSALNTLADHRRLAFVSKTPGRTQLINHFDIGNGRYLVDLPGYGYAKVPEAVRAPWGRTLGDYVLQRESLRGLVLIMDARHPMSDLDRGLLAWFRPTQKPVHILLTKADKLTRDEQSRTLASVRKAVALMAGNYSAQLFSSLKKTGLAEAEQILAGWLGLELPSAPAPAARQPEARTRTRTGTGTGKETAATRARRGSRNKKAPG